MSRYRTIFNKFFACLLTVTFLFFTEKSIAADGEALFKANCASCHKVVGEFTGPQLKGAREREPNPDWVYKWVYNVKDHPDNAFIKIGQCQNLTTGVPTKASTQSKR